MGTRKVVINACYGGFGLSEDAKSWIRSTSQRPNFRWRQEDFYDPPVESLFDEWRFSQTPTGLRDHWLLVQCVEALRDKANGDHANLRIVEIPEDVAWKIEEYDGAEHVAETHRTWHAG